MSRVQVSTSLGDMVLELYADKAPLTVANILRHIHDGVYDNAPIYRVLKDSVISIRGDLDRLANSNPSKLREWDQPIWEEVANGIPHDKHAIAVSRTPTELILHLKDNYFLNFVPPLQPLDTAGQGYGVFGKVIEGFNVVDAIASVQTKSLYPSQCRPVEPISILKMRVL